MATQTHTFTTIKEATKFIRRIKGKTLFTLMVNVWLPTSEGKAFPGMTGLKVSRNQMIKAIEGMGTVLVDQRGGKIKIEVSEPEGHISFTHICFG